MLNPKIKKFFTNTWIISLFLTAIYYLTHGYRYGWDDQQMEIPLLKSLIDPSLYTRDYFVHSVQIHFTTYFFPLLSKLITVEMVKPIYAVLFFISRYFLFFWMYKFWRLITKNKFTAFLCVLSFMVLFRYQAVLYLTFSHAEFTFPFVFAAFYYFYKKKYLTASVILGIATNFHALIAAYPMLYILCFLLIDFKKSKLGTFFKALFLYTLFASPLLIWFIKKNLIAEAMNPQLANLNWPIYYKKHASYLYVYGLQPLSQIFKDLKSVVRVGPLHFDLYLIGLYLLNVIHNKDFRAEKKNHIIFFVSIGGFLLGIYAAYIHFTEIFLILQLRRMEPYLLFMLSGYTLDLLLTRSKKFPIALCALMGLMFLCLVDKNIFSVLYILLMIVLIFLNRSRFRPTFFSVCKTIFLITCTGLIVFRIGDLLKIFRINPFHNPLFTAASITVVLLSAISFFVKDKKLKITFKKLFFIIPLFLLTAGFMIKNYRTHKEPLTGLNLLRADIKKIALYAKDNTPKDALFLIPYNLTLNNFRLFSERSIIFDVADEAIFPHDKNYVLEHKKRMADIGTFSLTTDSSYKKALKNAIEKYQVNYVVFPAYLMPKPNNTFQFVFKSDYFGLYKINVNYNR